MDRRVFLRNGVALVSAVALSRLPSFSGEEVGSVWPVKPYEGVGPVSFGMRRRKARRAVPGRPDKKDEFDIDTDDAWSELGVKLIYLPPKDTCQAVLFTGSKIQPVYREQSLLTLPARDALEFMRAADPDLSINGRGWTCMREGITVTAPQWQTRPKQPASSVLVFAEGYYTSFFD